MNQTWPLVETWAWMTSWFQVEALATQIRMALVVVWSPDTIKALGCSLNPSVTFGGITGLRLFSTDPRCRRPRHGPQHHLGLSVTMAPGGSVGHSDQHGPGAVWPLDTNMAPKLKCAHDLRW